MALMHVQEEHTTTREERRCLRLEIIENSTHKNSLDHEQPGDDGDQSVDSPTRVDEAKHDTYATFNPTVNLSPFKICIRRFMSAFACMSTEMRYGLSLRVCFACSRYTLSRYCDCRVGFPTNSAWYSSMSRRFCSQNGDATNACANSLAVRGRFNAPARGMRPFGSVTICAYSG